MRVAEHDGDLWLDLGNNTGRRREDHEHRLDCGAIVADPVSPVVPELTTA